MGKGWIIQHGIPQRFEPNGYVEGDGFQTSDLKFIDGLLREMQTEGNLTSDVNFVMEFTPTTKSYNREYSDRSHIAVSYDTDEFNFEFNPGNASCQPEERIHHLANIIKAWTCNEIDVNSQINSLKDRFSQLNLATERYYADMVNVLTKDYTRKELLKVFKKNFEKFGEEGFVLGQYFNLYLSRLESKSGNYDDYLPYEIGIPLQLGPVTVNLFYETLDYNSLKRTKIKSTLKEKISFEDANYRVKGKLLEPRKVGFSLESIHEAGFEGIRDVYWKVPVMKGYLGRGLHQRKFKDYPDIEISRFGRMISACGNFDISVEGKDFEYFRKLREHFGLSGKTESIPCNASIVAGYC